MVDSAIGDPPPQAATAPSAATRLSLGGLAHLGARYQLEDRTLEQLQALARLLARDPLAPTALRDPKRILNDHIADALVALEMPRVRNVRLLADIGAGAGVPGLPLAAALPQAHITLVEANARKCDFLRKAVAVMGLRNATVVQCRIEAWRDGVGRHDIVTARALASLDVVAEYAAPLLCLGGAVVAWRGMTDDRSRVAAERAGGILGLELCEPLRVEPYPGAERRHLCVLVKAHPTPPRFPRRAGVAHKRPLGRA